jgi:NDP-sugar pyrophosphorylase family protein
VFNGFARPKPLIDVNGQPMIRRVIDNLRPNLEHRFIFLVLSNHLRDYGLREQLTSWAGAQTEIVPVNHVTKGAACTVLLAAGYLSSGNDLVIANSDQLVDLDFTEFIRQSRAQKVDGNIVVFEHEDEKWSFARVNNRGLVVEVAEKRRISNLATAGIYYFRQGSEFVSWAQDMIAKDLRVNDEFYVCPVYNELVQAGRKVVIWKISQEAMHGLGTPEDLAFYLRRCV